VRGKRRYDPPVLRIARSVLTVVSLAGLACVSCAAAGPCELTPEEREERDAALDEIDEAAGPRVMACYQRAVQSKPTLEGDLHIEVHFAKGGAYDRTEFSSDELDDAELRACVAGVYDDYSLPAHTARCAVKTQESFMFMGKR